MLLDHASPYVAQHPGYHFRALAITTSAFTVTG
jgi:hypothetical protein